MPRLSRDSLSAIWIAIATVGLVAAIVGRVYWRSVGSAKKAERLAARAQPVLDALVAAESGYKEQHGTFWRDEHQELRPEMTKQALGVDLARAPEYRFAIAPPDLTADPTLRVGATGTGEAEGIVIECVYDAIARTKSCARR